VTGESAAGRAGTADRGGLRIAMVTTFYPPYSFGGDGQAVRRLAHALARRGHEVEIVHDLDAFRMLQSGPEPAPLAEPAGVRVHPLRSPLGALACLATHQVGRPVVHRGRLQTLLARGFDVIHFHNVSLIGGPGVLRYGRGIKLYTAHEHWLVCPSHILWRHDRELCDGRQCLRCVLHHRRPPQLWRAGALLEHACREVDAFLTYSRFCADKHREFGFAHPFTLIPPFLRDSGGQPAPPPPGTPPYFLFVGRLEAIKGVQDAIPWFRDGGTNELWIAGAGSYEPELRRLAGGAPRIRFLGRQEPEALARLYRGAIALLVPSICYEVFPMVVLEAFREGTPIIARNLGPFPEIVAASAGGLLFDDGAGLGRALARLENDPALRERLGAAAAAAFAARWSEDVALRSYLELVARLAERRGDRRVMGRLARSAA
jgi:glycosyltransferase involved in cell wall biosynthesis